MLFETAFVRYQNFMFLFVLWYGGCCDTLHEATVISKTSIFQTNNLNLSADFGLWASFIFFSLFLTKL